MQTTETKPKPLCGVYLGDNDGTCPQLTCIRDKGHDGEHDNVRGDHEEHFDCCGVCSEPQCCPCGTKGEST